MGRGVSIQRVGRHVCQVAAWAGWRTAWGEGVCPSAEGGGPERRKAAAGLCGPGSLSGSSSCTLLNSSHTFRSQRPGFPPTQPLPGTRARLSPGGCPGATSRAFSRSAAAPVPPRGPARRPAWTGRPGGCSRLAPAWPSCARPPSPCRSAPGGAVALSPGSRVGPASSPAAGAPSVSAHVSPDRPGGAGPSVGKRKLVGGDGDSPSDCNSGPDLWLFGSLYCELPRWKPKLLRSC